MNMIQEIRQAQERGVGLEEISNLQSLSQQLFTKVNWEGMLIRDDFHTTDPRFNIWHIVRVPFADEHTHFIARVYPDGVRVYGGYNAIDRDKMVVALEEQLAGLFLEY